MNKNKYELKSELLERILKRLSAEFNTFVESCQDENGNICAPDRRSFMSARACLPRGMSMAFGDRNK